MTKETKEKKIKLEVLKDGEGNKIIEAQYKIGSNLIKVEMTLEVLKAFKDYLFLDSEEESFNLTIHKKNTDGGDSE
jgi:hypothetical protein